MTDLLPCPFCGGAAERVDNGPTKAQMQNALSWGGDADDGGSFIRCTKCDASTALHFERRENLVDSWNRRTDSGLRDASEAVYNSWAGGEPIDDDMRDMGSALGMRADP